jgi:single-strand DNA-binding protein
MPTDTQTAPTDPSVAPALPRNDVALQGTLTEPGEERTLAGGANVVRWTLRVPRGADLGGSDLIDCVALDDELRQRALAWPQGLALTVLGALRRRFFRSGGRTTTRVEVEVHEVTEWPTTAPEAGD